MTDVTWGIAGGLGTGMIWAAVSMLVRSLSGTLTPAGITAVRSTIGGAIILAVALATGHGGEILRMPLWVVLALWASIIIAMAFGDTANSGITGHLRHRIKVHGEHERLGAHTR